MSHARTKLQKLVTVKRLYLCTTAGLTDMEMAHEIGVDRTCVCRYRKELNATEVSPGRYTLLPTQEDIALALSVLQRAHASLNTNLC